MDNIQALQAVIQHIDSADDPHSQLSSAMLVILTMLKSLDTSEISDAIQDAFLTYESGQGPTSVELSEVIDRHINSKSVTLN